ncbi:hypothetical protein Ancab_028232 [Ancistrocladus abbreviatus]
MTHSVHDEKENETIDKEVSSTATHSSPQLSTWDSETSVVAAECLVQLFISFFSMLRSQLPSVVSVLTGYVKSPGQVPAKTGIPNLACLASELGIRFSEGDWIVLLLALKEATASTIPRFLKVVRTMDGIQFPDEAQLYDDFEVSSEHEENNYDVEGDNLQTASYVVSRMKSHIAVQLIIIQDPPGNPIKIQHQDST